jgi:hypothetical protein
VSQASKGEQLVPASFMARHTFFSHQLMVAAHNDTGNAVAVAVQVFGGGVNDKIHAVGKRLLQERGRKGIVDGYQRVVAVRQFGQCGDIHTGPGLGWPAFRSKAIGPTASNAVFPPHRSKSRKSVKIVSTPQRL